MLAVNYMGRVSRRVGAASPSPAPPPAPAHALAASGWERGAEQSHLGPARNRPRRINKHLPYKLRRRRLIDDCSTTEIEILRLRLVKAHLHEMKETGRKRATYSDATGGEQKRAAYRQLYRKIE
ncbi:hypothetical protein EVAR_62363_1 [Eumeta japonica]|uniref:Uncharacterized protein n=1 Tax=Eumeta variegata TaxID=151549 RepID=A0A4C1ZY13_EUMVA|nr:hypothetical protein EVAR_62363_1 [Eumeta japonica]